MDSHIAAFYFQITGFLRDTDGAGRFYAGKNIGTHKHRIVTQLFLKVGPFTISTLNSLPISIDAKSLVTNEIKNIAASADGTGRVDQISSAC
ncbi:hypothetical protein [Agrobacterium larrymoorei]|uniref:Uncharacterized protein n=1 Tax=Agrobacterium larrymoorei TaxID=160699 RepID=A0ABX8TAX8_9HYPH|nr:hypothetical protein [Agrobacterium larrymoorei]QYA10432.1 hypothetical protein J5285_22305 [Agrobacterium larrymoorei]